jgi:hypothetical protein
MPIPETQLETWSHQGAISSSKTTHESIRNALNQYNGYPKGIKFDVYLHGSYKNDTNIRGDSDVDVVVELESIYYGNISNLPPNEQSAYNNDFIKATYDWNDFRSDILTALREYYGYSIIKEGKKSLKVINPHGGRLPADVIVCTVHKNYSKYINSYNYSYIEGMTFQVPSENRWIIGYPKHHYENGVKKNSPSETNGWYKPIVRVFKNARSYLIDHGKITPDLAPSYFLECLIYNAANDKFGGKFQTTVYEILKWLHEADYTQSVCQNKQLALFGNSPEQWSETSARKLTNSLIDLWNDWGK